MKILKTIILIISILSTFLAMAQENSFYKNKYLIVLDMQKDYIEGKIPVNDANEFIQSVNNIISKVDSNKIVYVKTEMIVASLSFKGISVDTIADLEFCKNLKVKNNNIFIKEGGNAFENEDLIAFFKENNTRDIVIVGLLAEKCITHTAKGGLDLGYNIFLSPSAILGKKEKSKNKSIKKLIKYGAKSLL